MSNITEHYGEQERERRNRKQARVNFLVGRDTITIHDSLEPFGKLVRAMESRGRLARLEFMQDRGDTRARLLLKERNGMAKPFSTNPLKHQNERANEPWRASRPVESSKYREWAPRPRQ